jgi:hypothetical protein
MGTCPAFVDIRRLSVDMFLRTTVVTRRAGGCHPRSFAHILPTDR